MAFRDMKFRVRGVEHSRAIQRALFSLGYRWGVSYEAGPECEHTDKACLYASAGGRLMYSGADFFDSSYNNEPEYFLEDGVLTAAALASTGLAESLPEDEASTTAYVTPPLGLRPRSVVEALRAREILEAMHRYVTADKPVPYAWMEELENCLVLVTE